MASQSSLPETMKACIATGFGPIDDNIFLRDDWPVPPATASSLKPGTMLVKVLSCALAPGDVRILSGKTDYVQLPEGGHPYIPGSDTAGMVVAVHDDTETKFKIGNYVISRFDEPKPQGGLAEYRIVKTELSEICPDSIPPEIACGLSASAMAAKRVVQEYVHGGDRVLIIGGSGAVGTSMIQYTKLLAKTTLLVAVSTQADSCRQLGADQVIDYRIQNWWEMPEFHNKDNQFDVVIDLVNGNNWNIGGCSGKAIKPSGHYVALMSGVETEIEVHGVFDMMKIVLELIGLLLYSRLHPKLPRWHAPEALKLDDGDLKALLDDVVEKRLQPVLDPMSPFPFTESGIRKAFALQKSRHAHGKVVVNIASKK